MSCGSQRIVVDYFKYSSLKINVCQQCGLGWQSTPQTSNGYFSWAEDIYTESKLRTKMYIDRVKRIRSFNPSPKIWLDVGCAGGGMLSVAKDIGYDVEGVEPGKETAEYVGKQLGIKIYPNILNEAKLKHSEYGVISYFHVLEHISNPVEELDLIKRFLHHQGILIIEVPDFGAFSWKFMGKNHRHLSKGHIYYFTKASIFKLLENNGFKILLMQNVPYFVSLSWYLRRLAQSMISAESVKELLISASKGSVARKLVVRSDLGDVLFVVAQILKT